MKTFNFEFQEKVSVWKNTQIEINAENLEEAKKLAIEMRFNGELEEVGWDEIYETESIMTPSENNNQPTAEIYLDGEIVWKNI
jgi:hypothetical protein